MDLVFVWAFLPFFNVRVGATARGTLKRDCTPTIISDPLFLNLNCNTTTNPNLFKFEMETLILSSSPSHESGQNWLTPKRAKVRQARSDGKSWGQINKELGVPRSSARRICKDLSSRRTKNGKAYQKKLLSIRDIRQIIRTISRNYNSRRMTFEQVKRALNIQASARTIRRELRKASYRRCIACSRPFISRAQAKKRLAFAYKHRWWGTSDWAASREGGGD